MDRADLPKLKDKQHACLQRYLTNGKNKTEAYRSAYDCAKMSTAAVYVEASRFFKNPKITLWLDFYGENVLEVVKEKINYSVLDYINDCDEMKLVALECRDKYGNPNVAAAIKADENKAKVCGLLKEHVEHSGSIVQMPTVSVDGNELTLQIGEEGEQN